MTAALRAACGALIRLLPDAWAIHLRHVFKLRRFANLRSPKTINDKVNWRKLHQRDPRFTLFSDKLAVKAEIARLIGSEHVIPTLWSGERPEEIPFDGLAVPYVIKVNHGFGGHIFVQRREDVDEKKITAALARKLRHSHGHAGREWGYYGIPRRILIEPLMTISEAGAPEDFKFFVYHGRVHFIQLDFDRRGEHRRAFYDREWVKLPVTTKSPDYGKPIAKPPLLGEMLRIAEEIGALFDFVRVDLYCAGSKVYFGEMTFYPSGGYSKKSPEALDLKFGEPWILPGAPET